MESLNVRAEVDAARTTATSLRLRVDDAVVIHQSNRLAVRLTPCDVLARVARLTDGAAASAEFEIGVARQLTAAGAPVAVLESRAEPRVYARDGFAVTLWRYYEPVSTEDVPAAEYADALARLHAGMRRIDIASPRFTDRVAHAERLVRDQSRTPDLPEVDRAFLAEALRNLSAAVTERRAPEQLLHGEPHPGNVLRTNVGPLFVDLETCCRGPVEFDLAHAPEAVCAHYAGADHGLLGDCRLLAQALVATWRWDREDEFPDGRRMGEGLLATLRGALANRTFDGV